MDFILVEAHDLGVVEHFDAQILQFMLGTLGQLLIKGRQNPWASLNQRYLEL